MASPAAQAGRQAAPSRQPTPARVPRPRSKDLTQDAAVGFVAPTTNGTAASATAAGGLNYTDPLAVAKAYVARRLTYRFDDPAGYTAALTAPALTTPGFAARSKPSASALARLTTAQETSTVQVGDAELEGEAPNSASTQYVVVAAAVTTAYRGGGATAPAEWTLRLLQAPPGQWRVDGVLSTD